MATILVNAISAKSGGAITYISNLASEIERQLPHFRFVFLVEASVHRRFSSTEARSVPEFREFECSNLFQRFIFDQVVARRIAREEKVDLLLSISDFGMILPPCLQLLMIRNSLYFSQCYQTDYLPRMSAGFRLMFRFRRVLVRLSAACSDLVVVASEAMRDEVQPVVGRLAVNRFGVPLEKFRVTSKLRPEKDLTLLFVSDYSDYKNLTTLLRAVAILKSRRILGFKVVTTADPFQFADVEVSSREADKQLARSAEVEAHVEFTGSVPYETVDKLYREADIFVFPSAAESFGHPLVEAMASGLPVIASDIPICREICRDSALYFCRDDAADLADRIALLMADSDLRLRLGRRGRVLAETEYDWRKHVARLLDTIQNLIEKENLPDATARMMV